MKRIISLLLCLCMLVPLLSGCELTVSPNDGVEVKTSGGENGSGNTGSGFNINAPKAGDILAVAKKYYDYHSKAIDSSLKSELSADVGAVGFDGKLNDADKAENLCSLSALTAAFEGDGDYAVAGAAAAVGWAQSYARSAGTLAAVLQQAGFVADKDRLNDAKKLAEYAISLDNEDIDFYITLAQIRNDLGDIDGALEAIEAALALDPGNYSALMMQLELTLMKGGAGGGKSDIISDPEEIGKKLKENDGELSKRDTEQEEAAKGMEGPKEEDGKEEALEKLHDLYALKVITPADMVEAVFPAEAKQLREKITTLTDQDKNLGLPDFPMQLLRNLDALHSGGYTQYNTWWIGRQTEFQQLEIALKMTSSTAYSAASDKQASDYMLDYNRQVVEAAIKNYVNYCHELLRDFDDNYLAVQTETFTEKEKAAYAQLEADYAAGMNLEVAQMKYRAALNTATKAGVDILVPQLEARYTAVRKEGQRLWEEMLPYARCTDDPGAVVGNLYSYVYDWSAPAWDAVLYIHSFGMYTPGITESDVKALEEAIAEATRAEKLQKPDILAGITYSVKFGKFIEIKLSTNKVEVEVMAGAGVKASYDWKKDEVGVGIGAGIKTGYKQVKLEAKTYINVIFDIRNTTVTDMYMSTEVKGKIGDPEAGGELEAGGQLKVSAFGKGISLSASVKQKIGDYAIKHDTQIISLEQEY